MTGVPPGDGRQMPSGNGAHLGERLLALLDGELDDGEAEAARRHLAGCPPCTGELDQLRAVRRALRLLPAVEPPASYYAALYAPTPVPDGTGGAATPPPVAASRAVLANVVAAFLVGLVLLGVVGQADGSVSPQLAGALDAHATALVEFLGGAGGTHTTATTVATDRLPAPYRAPLELAGYQLVGAYAQPVGLHLMYERGAGGLSVFEVEGHLDDDELPAGGRWIDLGGGEQAWQGPDSADGSVLVIGFDGLMVVLVGEDEAALVEAAGELPGPRSLSVVQRLRRACDAALEGLSPVG